MKMLSAKIDLSCYSKQDPILNIFLEDRESSLELSNTAP